MIASAYDGSLILLGVMGWSAIRCLPLDGSGKNAHRAFNDEMNTTTRNHEEFKGPYVDQKIVVLYVCWYLNFEFSFRDLVAMMDEHGNWSGAHDKSKVGAIITRRIRKRRKRYSRTIDGSKDNER